MTPASTSLQAKLSSPEAFKRSAQPLVAMQLQLKKLLLKLKSPLAQATTLVKMHRRLRPPMPTPTSDSSRVKINLLAGDISGTAGFFMRPALMNLMSGPAGLADHGCDAHAMQGVRRQ